MKTFCLLFIATLVVLLYSPKTIVSQINNCNPDPNGLIWLTGDHPTSTTEHEIKLESVPIATLWEGASSYTLESEVDNSTKPWFPAIYYQDGWGCCGQAAGIYYTFTYEINRLRGIPSDNDENIYQLYYAWNILNQGQNKGSEIDHGFDIVVNNGCPTRATFPVEVYEINRWMDGYSKYLSAISNRINYYEKVYFSTPEGYEVLKHWISHHNSGEESGGIAPFKSRMTGCMEQLEYPSAHENEYYMDCWGGPDDVHAVTIVGYCDTIIVEVDDDGSYTNDEDNNGDGVIDMKDWEKGALKVANSWGPYANNGYIWIPCSVLGNSPTTLMAFFVHAIAEYCPEYTAKIKFSHSLRDDLWIGVRAVEDKYYEPPNHFAGSKYYEPLRLRRSGPFPLLGYDNEDPLHLEFDITSETQGFEPHKFMLHFQNRDTNLFEGTIHEFTIVDRTGSSPEEFEVYCHQSDEPITDETESMIIDYNVLPANIQFHPDDIDYNCIVRGTTTIEGSNFDFTGTYIDFYDNARMIVKPTANIGFMGPSGSKIFAMRKTGTLELQGAAQFGQFASFNTFQTNRSEEHYFKVLLNAASENYNFSSNAFKNTRIEGFSNSVSFTSCNFENCDIDYYKGDFYLQKGAIGSSSLTNSSLKVSRPLISAKEVSITGSNFNSSGIYNDLLYIEAYDNFVISDNEFTGASGNGIYLFDAGHGAGLNNIANNQLISNCGEQIPLSAGICMYNSMANITDNDEISNSPIGIKMYRYSDAMIQGNQSATNISETQQIFDNDINQIYITPGSDPWYCHWNAIVDEDNTSPLYYVAISPDGDAVSGIDATYNYWGDNFNPYEDLSPGINYLPMWNFSISSRDANETEQMYNDAWDSVEDSNYTVAQNTFKLLINSYPDSVLAMTSLKDLFAIEDEAGGNYDSLKYYYQNEAILQSDSVLHNLAVFLVSMCDLKIENYQDVIDHNDSIIQSPASEQDSIFAIIDLSYAYQLQGDSSSRNIYIGDFPKYKFANYEDFAASREYHLSLLHKDTQDIRYPEAHDAKLENTLICFPNPFTETTQITFKGELDKNYDLKVFNSLGQIVFKNSLGSVDGSFETNINLRNFPSGLYLVVLHSGNKMISGTKIIKE